MRNEGNVIACFCCRSYVAPEYASTGMLNERSDVYSFGILIMEIISGRNPVDYSRPPGEVSSDLLYIRSLFSVHQSACTCIILKVYLSSC